MSPKKLILGWAHARDYGVLLASLLFISFTWAFVGGDDSWFELLLQIATIVMMASALFACFRTRAAFVTGLVVGLSSLISQGAAEVWSIEPLFVLSSVLRLLFYGMVTYGILADVVRSRTVTMKVIAGACSVYLLLAITFGTLYTLIESLHPGSFNLPSLPSSADTWQSAHDLRGAILSYYSLITLTTVGYGDITPASPTARMLSALEGLLGQLYIAVIMARLVGIEISTRMKDDS